MHTLLLGRSVAVPDTRLADVARTLSRHGRPVVVLTDRPLSGAGGAEVRPLGARRNVVLWALTAAWHAIGVLQLRRVDVIGATDFASALVAVVLSKVTGSTVVFDCRGSLTGDAEQSPEPQTLRWSLSIAFERFVFRQVDAVLVPTRAMRNDLVVRGLVPASKVDVLKAGVDTELIKPVGRARARGALVIDPQVMLIAFPSKADWASLKSMLTALVGLRASMVDVRLVIIGPAHPRLREAAHAKGVGDAVVVTGPVERSGLSTWLSACDVAVAPSRSELESDPFLISAMACGVATLTTDTAPHREAVNEPALLTPLEGAELSIRLSVLLTRSQRRQHFAERGRLSAQVEWAWEGRTADVMNAFGGGPRTRGPTAMFSPSR